MNRTVPAPDESTATQRTPPRQGRLAVIDVGSNSVRMVVFAEQALAAPPLFNEKVLCGLGRGQQPGGPLAEEAMDKTIATIGRFAGLARAMGVSVIDAVATAAVRDAANREPFLDRLAAATGVAARVLSGAEEARLSAQGVLSASPGARGLVGDLGGGSLELVQLTDAGVGEWATRPLGTLRLNTAARDGEDIGARIDAELGQVDWLEEAVGGDLFIVGGAWRSLGRLEMARTHYPLQVLHGFTLAADRVDDMCRLVAGLSRQSLRRIEAVPQDRLDTLPVAARVLGRLLRHGGARRVVFSAYGLREGVLREHLSAEQQGADPLSSACEMIARSTARAAIDGEALTAWLAPLFAGEAAGDRRLRLAAALLSDIGWRIHRDERADHAMLEVLRSPLVGLDHGERVKLALAVRARYAGQPRGRMANRYRHLVDEAAQSWAYRVGQALRLAHTFAGAAPELLAQAELIVNPATLILRLRPEAGHLMGEVVHKRLRALAAAFDREAAIEIG
ncbi:MAG: Ppx/GppA family phosphatase [Alphaproteobacteria bacterium]|jgi:exopolyphosphatase/guanosine-5'-triphosphate,3'-diphosphate pyrophosphatase|nr:Ppx/GppA family phosphatase [Alphaproteobacteria bacterium]